MDLTLCKGGNICMWSANFFSNSSFPKNSFSFKQFGSRSGPTNVGPDLDPNCLQRLSADDTSKLRVKVGMVFVKMNCTICQFLAAVDRISIYFSGKRLLFLTELYNSYQVIYTAQYKK